LKDLVSELIDAGSGFAGTGVAGDEPTATELVSFPGQIAKLCDATSIFFGNQQKPNSYDYQQKRIPKENWP
jgi:hypothetical protein